MLFSMRLVKLFRLLIIICFLSAFAKTSMATEKSAEPFYFGIFPYISGNRIVKLYKPLTTYLEQKLNRSVIIVTAPSFEEFLRRTEQRQYDLIFTAPHFAALEIKRGTYSHLVRFENRLKGNIFVASNSSMKTLADLKGKKIALPDKLAVISTLGEFYFSKLGFDLNEGVILQNTPSHVNTILAVLNKQADAGVVAWPVYNMFTKKRADELRLIGNTNEITGAMFMLSEDYSQSDRNDFLAMFKAFPESEIGRKFFKETPFVGMKETNNEEIDMLSPYLEVLERHL